MTISLSSYGTLEIPEVMLAVTGRSFDSTAAVLPDHARFLLHGEPPGHEPLLSQRPWERDRFVAQHLSEFLAYCRTFHGFQTHRLAMHHRAG